MNFELMALMMCTDYGNLKKEVRAFDKGEQIVSFGVMDGVGSKGIILSGIYSP